MSRVTKTTPARKSGGGTLVGMFIGLVLGVCIAAGTVWYINRANSPFQSHKPPQPPPQPPSGKPGASQQPLALPGKPGDPVSEKRFQFYDILPGKADAVPDSAKPETKKEASKQDELKKDETKKPDPKKEELKQPIFFQAGSFSSAPDADNQKARLALMGMEANILQVMVQDKTYYRVQLGPFRTMDEANKARAELAKAGIDASLVKKEQ